MLPSPRILHDLGNRFGLNLIGEHIFPQDYARTLAEWRRRFHLAWPDISKLGFDDRFKRTWDYYLHYCEAGFRAESIDVRQLAFSRA
jgi:cyclopropane-fatty-acyl-phospholipid synthase